MPALYRCNNCGYMGKPKTMIKGNFLFEIILWCMFLLPGAIYTMWRLTTRSKGCPKCGAPYMVPVA